MGWGLSKQSQLAQERKSLASCFKLIKNIVFDILACISDSYLRLTTAHTQEKKTKKTSIQRYPPSPPQGGDRFDLCVFINYKY